MNTWKYKALALLGLAIIVFHRYITGGQPILADPPLLDKIEFDGWWYLGALGTLMIPTAYIWHRWDRFKPENVSKAKPAAVQPIPLNCEVIQIPQSAFRLRQVYLKTRNFLEGNTLGAG